jgi:Bacterial HORMA domain family 1
MSYSYTLSETETFTVTHARHMAAKVATDLKRMQRLYGYPGDARIAEFEAEITEFLKEGYLGTVTYGFKRNGEWIEPTLRYTARDLADGAANDDDPGKVRPGRDVSGATFYSFLTYGGAWYSASDADKAAFEKRLPLQRGTASEPGVNGYLSDDRIYSSGGRALNRASVKSY